MKRVLVTAALVWAAAVALLLAQSAPRPRSAPTASKLEPSARATRPQSATPARAQLPSPPAETVKYRAWVNQYCVGCHNTSTTNPASDPVNLESASLDD